MKAGLARRSTTRFTAFPKEVKDTAATAAAAAANTVSETRL
jgi:hypothetical protein